MAKSKKKSKGLIPKRIAGVKVPKKVRKGRFGELLASKTGQAVIAQAILGAGAVAAGLKAKDNPRVQAAAKDAKHKVADAAGDAKHKLAGTAEGATENVGSASSAFAYALGEAARSFAEALRRGEPARTTAAAEEEANRWTADYGAPETAARQ